MFVAANYNIKKYVGIKNKQVDRLVCRNDDIIRTQHAVITLLIGEVTLSLMCERICIYVITSSSRRM